MAGSGGGGAKSAPLSCQQCRRRKIKCDRGNPCSFCVRIDVQCIPHTPSHAPRGRQGGRPKNNEELLQRIAKLENLVQEIESSNDGPTVKTEPEGQHTVAPCTAYGNAASELSEHSPTRLDRRALGASQLRSRRTLDCHLVRPV